MGNSEAWMRPRVPDKLQRASVAAQSRDPEATRHAARMGPGSAAHRKGAALRPGHESGAWGALNEEYDARASLFPHHLARRRAFSFSRLESPELCLIAPPSNPRGRREGRVPTGTRGPLREMHTQEEPHSSIQVTPITRPSLRDGWTAYAVLSREPNFPLASLAVRIG